MLSLKPLKKVQKSCHTKLSAGNIFKIYFHFFELFRPLLALKLEKIGDKSKKSFTGKFALANAKINAKVETFEKSAQKFTHKIID